MIDFHTHILPGLDDGAVTIDDSIAMARALSQFGYKTVCCTPHCIKGYYDLTPKKVKEATLMLQADLDNAEINLDLWPGMEYMLDEYFHEYTEDLLPLGDTKLVLCEASPHAHPGFVMEGLELIVSKGFVPLVAHPERTQFFYEKLRSQDAERGTKDEEQIQSFKREGAGKEPNASRGLLKRFWPFASRSSEDFAAGTTNYEAASSRSELPEGVLFHANLGSFAGFYGSKVQHNAYELLKISAYTALASDLHESRSASDVLIKDKFECNPFLKKLAAFDGSVTTPVERTGDGRGGQGELF
jgi:protein-tyrosine phosphatase